MAKDTHFYAKIEPNLLTPTQVNITARQDALVAFGELLIKAGKSPTQLVFDTGTTFLNDDGDPLSITAVWDQTIGVP